MALYHLSVKILGRSKGKSAVASYAYQSRQKVYSENQNLTFNYTNKGKSDKALAIGSFFTSEMQKNDFCKDGASFWNEVEKKENRSNSQFARDFDIALQSELSVNQNRECLQKWYNKNFLSRNIAGTYAIHAPAKEGNQRNLHAHVMVSTRTLTGDGWGAKDREANDRNFLLNLRESWADIVNNKFKELGIKERIDHRSLAEQGLNRIPQQHQGVIATAIARKGGTPDRGKYRVAEIKKIEKNKKNNETKLLLQELKEIEVCKKIQSLNPREWRQYLYNGYKKAQNKAIDKAQDLWVVENLDFIKNHISKSLNIKNNQLGEIMKKKPSPIFKKPLLSIAYTYPTDDGRKFKNYDEYKKTQSQIIAKWQKERGEILQKTKTLREYLAACERKDFDKVKNYIYEKGGKIKTEMQKNFVKHIQKAPELEDFRTLDYFVKARKEIEKEQRRRNAERNRSTGQER